MIIVDIWVYIDSLILGRILKEMGVVNHLVHMQLEEEKLK
jgi:hypothetical protein